MKKKTRKFYSYWPLLVYFGGGCNNFLSISEISGLGHHHRVVVAFIIVPSFFLFSALTEEAIKVYQHLESSRATDMTQGLPWLARYKETLTKYFPTVNFETRDIFSVTLGRAGEFLVQESVGLSLHHQRKLMIVHTFNFCVFQHMVVSKIERSKTYKK